MINDQQLNEKTQEIHEDIIKEIKDKVQNIEYFVFKKGSEILCAIELDNSIVEVGHVHCRDMNDETEVVISKRKAYDVAIQNCVQNMIFFMAEIELKKRQVFQILKEASQQFHAQA